MLLKMTTQIRPLTAVRFFAAMAVVMYHYGQQMVSEAPEWVRTLVLNGHTGVTLFFILSGFILVHVSHGTNLRSGESRGMFYMRRFARIYPVYMLAWLLWGVSLIAYWNENNVPPTYAAKVIAAYGSLSALLLQSWVPTAVPVWNWPGWTLSVEALFYALFPLLFAVSSRYTTRGLWLMLGACLIANGLIFTAISHSPWPEYLSNFPPAFVPQFVMGMMLGHLYAGGKLPRSSRAFTLLVIVSVLTVGTVPGLLARDALLAVLFCALVAALATVPTQPSRVGNALVLLGAASYATYILQTPLWHLFWRCLGVPLKEAYATGYVLLYVAVLLLASVLIYKYFERPMERWIKDLYRRVAIPHLKTYSLQSTARSEP